MQLKCIVKIIILGFGLVGCASLPNQNRNTPATISCGKDIPTSIIEIGGVKQQSRIGGYCWSNECGEPFGWPSPDKPVVGKSPVVINFGVESPSQISHLEYQLRKVTNEDKMKPNGYYRNYPEAQRMAPSGTTIWDIPVENVVQMPPLSKQELKLKLEPGTYLLTVFAWWKGCGDATHGFLIEAE